MFSAKPYEPAGPKGVICYYSGSGNTRLACQYIQSKVRSMHLDLFNIVRSGVPELHEYAVVGFATFTDFLGPPFLMRSFIARLEKAQGKPAFVFNTYGALNGKTLSLLAKWAGEAGFTVIAGHTLHTPESYPPMVAGGHGNEDHPNEKELDAFKRFVAELDRKLSLITEGKEVRGGRLNIGFLDSLLIAYPRTQARRDMGLKHVDETCDECGACEKVCPYGAIRMDPKPVFDMEKCYGCWSCYNHCPRKSIYTSKLHGRGQYPKPNDLLREKLKPL